MNTEQPESQEHTEPEVTEAPGAEAPAEDAEAVAEGEETVSEGDGEYKIGDQAFKTSAEAFKYANDLVYKQAITEAQANAYRQAVSDTAQTRGEPQNVTQNAEPEEEDFEEKFYANPKEYLKEFATKIRDTTKQEVLGQLSQQSEDDKLWGNFFKQNPDLEGFREDCEATLGKYQPDIKAINQTKGQKAAMDYLAQKTRAKFQAYHESAKPRRELPRTSSGPSMGSPGNVTRNAAPEQDLDFTAQIRNLRNKRA